MKTCKTCGESKPLDAFYAHPKNTDGHSGTCKDCKIRYAQGRYVKKRPVTPAGQRWCSQCKEMKPVEEFAVDAARAPTRGGIGRQTYCKPCHQDYQRNYSKGTIPRQRHNERINAHRKTPEGRHRNYARILTWLSIKFGYLVQQPCEICGSEKSVVHHTQYEKPLDGIRWLCEVHHLSHGHDGDWTKPPV